MRKIAWFLYFFTLLNLDSFADGLDTWTKVSTTPYGAYTHLVYGNGMFAANSHVPLQGESTVTNGLSVSGDGLHWTHAMVFDFPSGLAFGNGTFVKSGWSIGTSGDAGFVYDATNAIGLTNLLISNVHNGEYGATYGKGLFVVVGFSYEGSTGFSYPGNTGTLITSTDGLTWTQQNPPTTGVFLDGVASSGSGFLAVGYTEAFPGQSARAFSSSNGTNWFLIPTSITAAVQPLTDIAYIHNGYYATAAYFAFASVPTSNYFTATGASWTQITPPFPSIWIPLTGTNGLYVSINSTNGIYTSSDATNWVLRQTGITNQLTCIAFDGHNFVAASADGSLFRSGSIVPSLNGQSVSTNGGFQLSLTGGLAEQTYQLQASTNLSTWTNVFAFTNVATLNQFLDTNISNYSRRYYRTVTQ